MSEVLVDTIFGSMEVPASQDDLIRRFLNDYGEWGYTEALLASRFLPPHATVFDVGAFIGTFSLGITSLGAERVIAVEPQKEANLLLTRNLRRSIPQQSVSVRAVVGERVGFASIASVNDKNAGACRWMETTDRNDAVEITTLQDLRVLYGNYDFLKLDVEGWELQALKGDWRWIKETRPLIWAECNESVDALELLSFLHWADLNPHYVAFPSYRKSNYRGRTEHNFPIAYEAALVGGRSEVFAAADWSVDGEEILVTRVESAYQLRKAMWQTPRWGHASWANLSKLELLAMLTRLMRKENFDEFLIAPKGP